ncbi:transmembrane protein 17B [Corythoichthys intestinalis]|uniref:transmembrane protein 17B n=1 Tax=Corythoichthys intestinalis TaxID=161448 RepID=UPI0025A54E75|nr:transmembrane protein 17B [Corythoichthys intestinalis]XP_061812335.1 transmembrane protein 17B-like [Nerophis lumbriciformis]
MDLPDAIRKRLEDFSRNFFEDPNDLTAKERYTSSTQGKPVLSSLPLQMSLFFNMCFFPLWCVTEIVMLQLKYSALPEYYRTVLITVLILMTLIETIRLYLGYVGNLREEIAELAGFWLLSILLQLPQSLFQLFNEGILIQPLERGIHIVLVLFILWQGVAGFAALRNLVRHTESQFHLRQFD